VADPRVLVVEDDAIRLDWFRRWFPEMDATDDPAVAIEWLQLHEYTSLFLDQDLGHGDAVGRDVSTWLASHRGVNPDVRIFVHSMNTVSAEKMVRELHAADRSVQRLPFSEMVAGDG
jgi:hypothetical protein